MKIRSGSRKFKWAFPGLIAILLAACAVEESDIKGGLFVDAPVEGLMYQSGSLIGRTDAEGRFYYETGQDITFSIEDVVIATIEPKDFVAPFDLVSSTAFLSDTETVNISRLIQSLDEDGDPDNGITISETTREAFQVFTSLSSPLDFSSVGFGAISSLFAGTIGDLRSPAAAKAHLLASLGKYKRLSIDLINLGDGFTAGMQSSGIGFENVTAVNIHYSTQSAAYASLFAGRMRGAVGDNLTWVSPQLEMDALRNKSIILGEVIPYNLAVPGATAMSLVNYTTGTGDAMADLLLQPLFANLSGSPSSGTQLDAAKLLASQKGHERHLKVFTLWIGMNDVLGALTQGGGTLLDETPINSYLSDAAHDLATVMTNISTAVRDLSAIDDSYLFIATLPDVTRVGSIYYREDIESLAQFDNVSATALKHYSTAGGTDVVAIGPYAFAHYSSDSSAVGVSRSLDSDNTTLNAAISAFTDTYTLTKAEVDLVRTRVDGINTYIRSFDDPHAYPGVFVVDINGMFEELSAGSVQVGTGSVERRFGGGFFSLDGVYPSNTGYGLIAKEFIERIGSPFTLATSDASYSNYSSYVAETGINPANGIGIDIGPESLDLASIRLDDPYRDRDGDGFPAGPGNVVSSDEITAVSGIDPSLELMRDCSDSLISNLPEAVSGFPCGL